MAGTDDASPQVRAGVRITIPDRIIQALPAELRDEPAQREPYLLKALELGLKCLAVAGVHLDTDVVRTEFGRVEEAVKAIEKGLRELMAAELTDEDSRLLKTLKGGVSDLATKLSALGAELADPARADSVPGRTKRLLDDFFNGADGTFRKAMSLSHKDSPLRLFLDETDRKIRQYRADLDDRFRPFEERFTKLEANIGRLLEQAGFKQDLQEARDKSSAKGTPFEEQVADVLAHVAFNSDRVDRIGDDAVDGTRVKRGDVLVHVEQEEGEVGRIVVEAKAGAHAVRGKDGLLKQLADAMEYRDAQAGIAVVTKEHAGQRQRVYDPQGRDRIVVVVDPGDEKAGFLPLELAYLSLRDRLLAIRREGGDEGPDTAAAENEILGIANALNTVQAMKRNCTEINKNADKVRTDLEEMEKSIRERIGALQRHLGLR